MTSNTGLLASKTKKVALNKKKKSIHLAAIAVPAPIVLRPFADLYNPFSYGCSLLCNHPVDREAKDILKKARETWAQENKIIILPEEVQAIRDSLAIIDDQKQVNIDKVPEELFRRYTDTDSRPLTPAPTLASVKTRGSGSRRCVTPDPITTSILQERKLLILDLRRSHSQEIISWTGTNCDVPTISILQPPTPSISIDTPSEILEAPSRKETPKVQKSASPKASPKKIQKQLEVPKVIEANKKISETKVIEPTSEVSDGDDDEEEEIRRKGKIRRRKKRGRDSSRGPLAVEATADPETMVSSAGQDSEGKPLVKTGSIPEQNDPPQNALLTNDQLTPDSFLEPKILKHLQRELNYETVDLEFNNTRRIALEEAYKTLPVERKPICKEMKQIQKELNVPPINSELWLTLPRVYSRRSIRFELPLHSVLLSNMKPLQYMKEHVRVSSGRQLLYNMVFKRHQNQELENERLFLTEEIRVALGEMMGKELTDKQFNDFYDLVYWNDSDQIDFQTWCGICGLFERLYAREFCPHLPGKDVDPCSQVEIADFESLTRRLQDIQADERLVKILYAIKES